MHRLNPLLLGILTLCASSLVWSACAADLPAKSDARTTALFGAAVAGDRNPAIQANPRAFTGHCASPDQKYQVLASAPIPAQGDTLSIWIHYRNLALQMKTNIAGKTTEFAWNWNRHSDAFAWRQVGSFPRSQLGAAVYFICDSKFSPESGINAIVITADSAWQPAGTVSLNAPKPSSPAADLNAPDAANATVTLATAAPEESAQPGSALVTIDWARTGAPLSPALYSLNNFHGTQAAKMSSPAWHAGITYMAPRLLRIHNSGLVKTWFNPATGTWDREKIRAALSAGRPPAGTELMITIPGWPASYDADDDGRLDPDHLADYARLCAGLVDYVNHDLKLGVRYWEITNEKDFAYWRKPREGRQPDVAALATVYNTAAAAMRKADPTVKIGGPAACSPLPAEPLVKFASLTRDQLDFFSFHDYASGSPAESDQTIYQKTAVMAADAADLIRRVQKTIAPRTIEFQINEYNICYSWRVPEPRMTNPKGAVFDALMLIAYAQIPGLTMTAAWNDQDSTYGKMDARGDLRPGAYVYHYFNTLLRGSPAATATTAPQAVVPFAIVDPVHTRLAFALVNRTNGEQTVTLNLEHDPRATAWSTASIDADGLHPASLAAVDAPLKLPPNSVHFFWQG